jgi:hypothetical protein
MSLPRRFAPALLVLCFLSSAAWAEEKVTLGLRLTKGQKFTQTMETVQKITQDVQGVQQVVDQVMGFTMTNHVTDVDADGVATVEIVYDAVKWSQATAFGKNSYDSTKDKEATGPAKAFAAMVGAKITSKMKRDGTITDIKGTDVLLKNVLESLELPAGPQADLVKKQMKDQFGDAAMKQQLENLSAIYPTGPVGVGDSWKKSVEMNAGMALSLETVYTYKGRKDGQHELEASGKIGTPENAKPLDVGAMKLLMSMSGKQKGTIQMDEKTGLATSSDLEQDLVGTTTVLDGDGKPVVKIPMSIVSKVKVTTATK